MENLSTAEPWLNLGQNDLQREVIQQLVVTIPNFDYVATYLKKLRSTERNYSLNNLEGILAEFILRIQLEEISLSYGSRLVFDPMEHMSYTENYVIGYRPDRPGVLLVKKKLSLPRIDPPKKLFKTTYTDIDQLILFDDLPVIFEVQLMKLRGKYIKEKITRVIKPVREYFSMQPGLVLILPPEHISSGNRLQKSFQENHGIIIPFYKDRDTYRKEILELYGASSGRL